MYKINTSSYKLLTAGIIATLMITAVLSSLTTVSGTHEKPDVSITPTLVKENDEQVFTLTVANPSGSQDNIDNLTISLPAGWSDIRQVAQIAADENVFLTPGWENQIVLPAGTLVTLYENTQIELYENTIVIRKAGENIYIENNAGSSYENGTLIDNLELKLLQNTTVNSADVGLDNGDNVTTKVITRVSLSENKVGVLTDSTVVVVSDNVVRFADNADVKILSNVLVNSAENGLDNQDDVTTSVDRTIMVDNGHATNPAGFTCKIGDTAATMDIAAGASIWPGWGDNEAIYDNEFILSAGTTVRLADNALVQIPEDTEAIKPSGENVTALTAEDQPKGWTMTGAGDTSGTWTANAPENMIQPDESADFPFAATSAAAGGTYPISWTTVDNGTGPNNQWSGSVNVTIDNTRPKITSISISPDPVGENGTVDIEIVASEVITKPDNIMVAERGVENVQISDNFTSDDNITWTGTYSVSDNWLRDNTATLYVVGNSYQDKVGHLGLDNSKTFTIDRCDPPAPSGITSSPTNWPEENTNNTSQTISVPNVMDNVGGSLVEQSGMTVKVSVNGTVHETTSLADNSASVDVELNEGPNTIKVWFVDDAGNVGAENEQSLFLDTREPTYSSLTPENGAITSDSTPLIGITWTDPGYDDNTGLGVTYANLNDNTGTLTEALTIDNYDEDTGRLEYTTPSDSELADDNYLVWSQAGDPLENHKQIEWWFIIDTTPPSVAIDSVNFEESDGTDVFAGGATDKSTLNVSGEVDEDGSTIRIYVKGSYEQVGEVTEDPDDDDQDWETTVTLDEGRNEIYIEETDVAGNTSDKAKFGAITVDATAPTIALSSETSALDGTTTSKTSVTIKATITDNVADYKDMNEFGRVTVRSPEYTIPESGVRLSADDELSVTVPLREGMNKIDIIAQDTVGNIEITSIVVTRTVTPWSMYLAIVAVIAIILAVIAILRRGMGSGGSLGRQKGLFE